LKKVSIITICYNAAATIEDTIQSVLRQDYPQLEYIIKDAGSTDDTLKIVAKYKERIAQVIVEKDKGLYDGLNRGIDAASGEVIGFLHSDDFYIHDKVISDVVSVFDKEKCDAVYADLYYVDRKDTKKIIRKWKSGKYKEGLFLEGWMPPHPTFFVKKECYSRYGVFNLELKSAADYELMLRFIHKHKIRLGYLPEYIIKMRAGGKSNVSLANRIFANKEDRFAWKINDLSPKFYTLTWKPIRKIFQYL
jgi:glycosyltransferase involved in cell wall biosynthesis